MRYTKRPPGSTTLNRAEDRLFNPDHTNRMRHTKRPPGAQPSTRPKTTYSQKATLQTMRPSATTQMPAYPALQAAYLILQVSFHKIAQIRDTTTLADMKPPETLIAEYRIPSTPEESFGIFPLNSGSKNSQQGNGRARKPIPGRTHK